MHQQILDECHYSHTRSNADNSYKTLPIIVVSDKQTNDYFKQKAIDLLSDYQDITHEDSATLKEALFSFLIVVYRLPLGTKMDKICLRFNNEGTTMGIDCEYNICWFSVVSFALHHEIDQTRTRVSDTIKLFLQFNDINPSSRLNKANKQLLESYKEFNYVRDLERFQQIFKMNTIAYICDDKMLKTRQNQPEQFSKFEEHIIDTGKAGGISAKDFLTVNVLLVPLSFVDEIHAMYISDIDKVINGKLCPLNCQMIFNTTNQNYKRELARHLKYQQGPQTTKQVKLDHLPKPYYSDISKNILQQKLIAIVENIIDVDNVIAQLEPLSVASAATVNGIITTLYFDLRNGSDFIEQWISQLFEVAIKVNEVNQSNIPDVAIEDKRYEPYKPQTIVSHYDYDFDLSTWISNTVCQGRFL
ncbi:MAG: hypothetical protein EZS28_000090 [Streblomastix strix]|uniref:Uncharacterized protein n=1 Tax=Streblomastix strix TaxID=222440 RepID=A0A5J4XCY5_9EUKA|nr:MAG: hypothetical protein EZS28_000090 [Streblomastix strix]